MDAIANREAATRARLTTMTAEFSGHAEGDIEADKTFLELGFDSLFLTQLATAFQKEFNTPVAFRQLIADQPTINALAAHLVATAPPATVSQTPPEITATAVTRASSPKPAATPARTENSAPPAASSELTSVFARQLELMRDQLELLRSAKSTAALPLTAQAQEQSDDAPAFVASVSESETPGLPEGFGPKVVAPVESSLTAEQRAHVDRLAARYNAKTAGSKALAQEDRTRHADPRTAAGFNAVWKEMVYPLVVKRSKGAHLWDIDDNQYIDLLNGFGPNFFGHRAPFVIEALKEQLGDGFEIGPQTPRAGDAAKLLCELTGMDRASWVNTGSEAVQAAIRIARTVTGRDKIVLFKGSYHGNFDEVLVRGVVSPSGEGRTLPMAPGIPFSSVDNVMVLDYGETSALDAIERSAKDIAAVLVEPVQSRRPEFQPREFLHQLRALTEREDIALVFDEVITGFRTAPGGAQEYFDVKADLATYGKVIGGGMPIGAVAGRARFMDTFDGGQWRYGDGSKPEAGVTFFAGTFVRHPMAIAAAHASLLHLKEQGPALQRRAADSAARLANELNAFFVERNVKFHIAQFSSQMFIRNDNASELATLFFYHLRDRGVHALEGFPCYMTTAHTDDDVDMIIAAAKDAILEMQTDGLLPRPAGETGAIAGFQRKLPLTPGQRTIWATSQLSDMASCAFNESDSIRIEGELETETFVSAVSASISEHEAFRLRFDAAGDFQFFAEEAGAAVAFHDLSVNSESERQSLLNSALKREALTPFDLEHGPLIRPQLFRIEERVHLFVLYAHHLVFDGYSSDLLIRDIVGRYRAAIAGETMNSSKTAPFSSYLVKTVGAEPLPAYWREIYADGPPPLLDLPTDYERPQEMSYRGATVRRRLSPSLCADLREVARRLGVSMSALTTAAFAALLSRLANREDLVVGTPVAGQARHGIEAVGYGVNVLPVRIRPERDASFAVLAKSVQAASLDAFENSDVSVSALIDAIDAPRLPGRVQLIEVVFNFAGYFAGLDAPGVKFSAYENRRFAVCQDLFVNVSDAGETLVIDLEYAADLFRAETIERWIDGYTAVLARIVRDPQTTPGEFDIAESRANIVAIADHQDRAAKTAVVETSASAPQSMTSTEQIVLEAAAATFARDDISIDDNFFDLGGHSIHASRLLTRLRRLRSQSLGIRAIFESESLRGLAAHIDANDNSEREEFVF